MVYLAQRTALNDYSLREVSGTPVSSISFTSKIAVWTAEGAPLTGMIRGAKQEAFPILTIQDRPHLAKRRLLTNNLLLNEYDLWLEREEETVIAARIQAARWATCISYQEHTYQLRRRSFFRFRFDLQRSDGIQVASLRETTSFWSVSVHREFALASSGPVDSTLLTFAFFLAATDFFS